MTRVVVTGGSGKLGRAVVADLLDNGYQVVNLDRVPRPDPTSPFVRVDFTDYGQIAAALLGGRRQVRQGRCGGAPGRDSGARPDHECRDLRQQHHQHLSRVRGRPGGEDQDGGVGVQRDRAGAAVRPDTPPPYIPVDEEYHPRPNSSYSLAKTLEEEMAGAVLPVGSGAVA